MPSWKHLEGFSYSLFGAFSFLSVVVNGKGMCINHKKSNVTSAAERPLITVML